MSAERPRSNTPLAALALLNDPIFVEAARALAEELLIEPAGGDDDRAHSLWLRALQRSPSTSELRLITELVAAHREHYTQHPDTALQLLSVGDSPRDEALAPAEHAAWTSAARVILNLHETIVRN